MLTLQAGILVFLFKIVKKYKGLKEVTGENKMKF